MAFVESWVETDPDGSVITVSLLDDHTRLTKRAVRERLEGDPAVLGSGVFDAGTFGTTAMVKKGVARGFTVTDADLTTTYLQDGRLAVNLDTNTLYHSRASGLVPMKVKAANIIAGTMPSGTTFPDITVTPGASSLQSITGTTLTLTGAFQASTASIQHATNATLTMNTTGGAVGDANQIFMQRGGAGKWRFGTNIDGLGVDSLNIYNEAGTMTMTIAKASNNVTFASAMTINGVLTVNSIGAFTSITSTVGTNPAYVTFNNTGGAYFVGADKSDGSALSGVPYALALSAPTTRQIAMFIGAARQFQISETGAIFNVPISMSPTGNVLIAGGVTTANRYIQLNNTSGQLYLGVESNVGGSIVTGSTAYDTVLTGQTGLTFSANNGTNVHMRIASTGATTFTGGNTNSIGKAIVVRNAADTRYAAYLSHQLAWSGAGTDDNLALGTFGSMGFYVNNSNTPALTISTASAAAFSGAITATSFVGTAHVYVGGTSEIGWNLRAKMRSPADGIITLYNDPNTDFTRMQFGGTTASFPALARNATTIDVILADGSAYAPLHCAAFTMNGAFTGATTGVFSGLVSGATGFEATAAGAHSWNSRSIMRSSADGLITLLNNAENNFTRLMWGGTTAAFPALARNGAGLQAVLADNSASASFTCLGLVASTGAFSGLISGSAGLTISSGTSGLQAITGTTLSLSSSLQVGSGATVLKWLTATLTWDPGSLVAGASAQQTVTVTGAAVGDLVCIQDEYQFDQAGFVTHARVSSANTVTVTLTNASTVTTDPASRTVRVWVIQF